MSEIYTFNGKDITMNVFIQIRAVVDIIKEARKIDFIEALGQFYHSDTYKTLQNTENGWRFTKYNCAGWYRRDPLEY